MFGPHRRPARGVQSLKQGRGDFRRHVPLNVREQRAKSLVHLARYLHTNDFANDLVEQINVAPDGRVALIPRIGCQVIQMGKLDSLTLRTQMQNLRVFYDKVLPTVGWNTYREISLEFNNQIVCKKN